MDESIGQASWNSQLEKILSDEGERALCYSWLHDRSEKLYSRLSTTITLPSIVMATLSGSASIGIPALVRDTGVANIVIGLITLSVAILTTVNSYFAWAKRSESHRIADITYKKIYKFILIELALPRSERMAAKDMLKIVRDECGRLEETSPQIPDTIIQDFKSKFSTTTPDVMKPEITNGLHPIYVYPGNVDSPFAVGKGDKPSDELLDPIYKSPKLSIIVPSTESSVIKISSAGRTQDTSQTSSSVHLPSVSEAGSIHTSPSSYTESTTGR